MSRALEHLAVHRLGLVGYEETFELQRRLVAARQRGLIGDVLLLLEHRPVLTLGRNADADHILYSREQLEARGLEVHEVGRGGDVTYHGPGQVVGYPIVDLSPDRRDVRKYVWSLEETMIRLAAQYDIQASRLEGFNGTWVESRKIGAVGVRISKWVTMHGFAFNASPNLGHFQLIVPCGIEDKGVTSVALETGQTPTTEDVIQRTGETFASLYESQLSWHDGPPELPLGFDDMARG